jgi:FKBP-type peptidyl-prolyl cis-trans isomerase
MIVVAKVLFDAPWKTIRELLLAKMRSHLNFVKIFVMRTLLFLSAFFITLSVSGQSGDTIITPTGLRYIVLRDGAGARPVAGNKVTVMYKGMFMDGKQFEASDVPFKYKLGDPGIIPGWNEGLLFMPAGALFRFLIPARYAYGDKGARNPNNPNLYDIPPGTDLMFDIELLKVKP